MTRRPARGAIRAPLRHERWWAVLLLSVHAALAVWGAAENSVTFDENFHLPDGVAIVARGDFHVSQINPPLAKALCTLPALAAGARLPADPLLASQNQAVVGEAFMRTNAHRYHRIFFAGRLAAILFSLALGFLVWRFARRLYGSHGGLFALGLYALAPEALAHAGVAGVDVATGLVLLAAVYGFWIFARSGRWRAWGWLAVAVGLAALTRFSTILLAPILVLLGWHAIGCGRARRPRRVWLRLGLLVPTTLLALDLGYLGQVSMRPLKQWTFHSAPLRALQQVLPALRPPLPDPWIAGFDWQSHEFRKVLPTFLFGQIRYDRVWYYFPLALLFKWPLGFLGALLMRPLAARWTGRARRHELFLLLPPALMLVSGMFLVNLNAGVRYMFPLLPFLCVWLGGLVPRIDFRGARAWTGAAVALIMLEAAEVASTAPWYLAFFNQPSGGPGGGAWLVNDSNLDWGQGLIALRRELARRHIGRIHLAYHGTTDPAVYGIDYIPYLGGTPTRESDWIAISSYYFVGLQQRMMTSRGPTAPIHFDFRVLWGIRPEATPAHCMLLFRVERADRDSTAGR